jgi:type II secretory pathway pseudopilin PulG
MAVMKRIGLISAAIFLLALFVPFQGVNAQEKSKEEKEKELQMQEIINAQKRAMTEQKRAQEEMIKEFKDQQNNFDEIMEDFRLRIDTNDFGGAMRIYGDRNRDWFNSSREPVIVTPEVKIWTPFSFSDTERTTWEFSKSVKEKTFSRDYIFDVEPTVGTVIMSVNGDCKAGDIRIKIVMPNGNTYSDIIIDEFGNLNWRKSFKISDEENKDKTGAWKFEIKSAKATGYFNISLQTY